MKAHSPVKPGFTGGQTPDHIANPPRGKGNKTLFVPSPSCPALPAPPRPRLPR